MWGKDRYGVRIDMGRGSMWGEAWRGGWCSSTAEAQQWVARLEARLQDAATAPGRLLTSAGKSVRKGMSIFWHCVVSASKSGLLGRLG